eukprot:403351308
MSISLFKKQLNETSLAEKLYQHQLNDKFISDSKYQTQKVKKTPRELRQAAERKNKEKVLLRKQKKQSDWKIKKKNNNSNTTQQSNSAVNQQSGDNSGRVRQFKSKLDKIQEKDQRTKEIKEVQKQARKEVLGKSRLSKNISKVILNKYK